VDQAPPARDDLGGAGTIVGFAILTVVLTLTTASTTPTDDGGPDGSVTLEQLAASDGLAVILPTAAAFIGVVALSVFAISIASEYSQGTLRNLLVRQPCRARLLAGELLALASFTTIAVLIAGVAAVTVALLVAPTQDISTSAWFTSAGWTALGAGLGNRLLATLGWGLLGTVLALVLRAPAAAVGVGLAYALPGELLVTAAWADGARWLPGQLLDTLAQGGSAAVTNGWATTRPGPPPRALTGLLHERTRPMQLITREALKATLDAKDDLRREGGSITSRIDLVEGDAAVTRPGGGRAGRGRPVRAGRRRSWPGASTGTAAAAGWPAPTGPTPPRSGTARPRPGCRPAARRSGRR
jgi:ABC-2 type transport system permease protein